MKKLKLQKGTFSPSTPRLGNAPIEALITPNGMLALHRSFNGRSKYSISHVPTGLVAAPHPREFSKRSGAGHLETKLEACALIVAMIEHPDGKVWGEGPFEHGINPPNDWCERAEIVSREATKAVFPPSQDGAQ